MSDTRVMIEPSLCTWGPKTKQRHTSQPSYYGALPQRVKTSWSNKQRYNLKYWYWEALRHHKPAKDFPFCVCVCVFVYFKMCDLSPWWDILNSGTRAWGNRSDFTSSTLMLLQESPSTGKQRSLLEGAFGFPPTI